MSSTRRIITLVVDDTAANEDLNAALQWAAKPPWAPVPPGENVATYDQQRVDQETTDALVLEHLKRCAPRVHWVSSTIIPKESTDA